MKRKTTFLAKASMMLLAVLFSFTSARADEFTVYTDGEATSGNVPVEGYWADAYQKCEFVIAQAELTPLAGRTISEMTFYLPAPATAAWGGKFQVFMKEVSEATISAFSGTDDATIVFEGQLDPTQSTMTIAFSNLFTYNGGNLLVGVYETEKGSYKSATFIGAEVEGASIQGHSSNSLDQVTANQKNFIPKTTFTYYGADVLLPPSGLKVNYDGGTEATVSWSSEESSFDIDVNGTITEDVENPCTLTNLEFATTYNVMVRAKKGTEVSDWAGPVSFSTDLSDDMCQIQLVLLDSWGDGWNGSAAIQIADVATGIVIGTFKNDGSTEKDPQTILVDVPNDRDIQFSWITGSYDEECSYTAYDVNGQEIFSGSGAMTAPVTYHVDCVVTPYRTPTNFTVSEITKNSAQLSWTENGTATEWVINVYDETNDDSFGEFTTSENPYTLTGLDPETQYTANVRPAGENNKWSEPVHFTTADAFAAPADLAASNVTATSAEINWTGTADSYNLRYAESNTISCDFESVEAWSVDDFAPFTAYDGDGASTYGIQDATFTNQQYTGSVITMENDVIGANWTAHSGNKFGCFMACTTPPNNDFFITPEITIAEGAAFSFWARSVMDQYGLERMKVGVYDGNGTFSSYLAGSASNYVEVPTDWTEYSYDLSAYKGQTIQLAINCVSNDAFALFIDDVSINLPPTAWSTSVTGITTTSYQLDGLTPEKTYVVQVQAVYAGGVSKWTTTNFTTPSSNPVPSNIEADLTADGATFTWEGEGESYNVQYRTAGAVGAAIFEDDFSGDLSQWTLVTAGEGDGWVISEYGATSYSWTQSAGAIAADNWLISPAVELGGILKFYANTATAYPDSYEVLLSTTGTETTDFTETLKAMATATPGYVTIDLSAYAGTGYIAIHHVSSDCYILAISNFGVYEYIPAGAWQDMAVTEKTASISGLTTNALYEYQIQSVKGGETSEWSTIQDFALLTLDSNADNSNLINTYNGKFAHVTLANRTFIKDGKWNTIYLPFDMSLDGVAASSLGDADIRTLKNVSKEGNDVTLTFTEENEALTTWGGDKFFGGVAYIAKWAEGSNTVNPEFANVTITSSQYYVGDQNSVKFVGTYAPKEFDADDTSILFVGADNKLNYPLKGATIGAMRGYFQLIGITAESSSGVKFYTNLDDEDPTGISLTSTLSEGEGDWYDLGGRKLAGKPTMKGIYVNGGRKVTIK